MKKILYLISASLLMLMGACQEIEVEEAGINFSPEKVMQVDLAAQEVTVTISHCTMDFIQNVWTADSFLLAA